MSSSKYTSDALDEPLLSE